VARFYLDENVSEQLILALRDGDHDVTSAIRVGQRTVSEAALLLDAAHRGRIFITHNMRDFQLLHEALRAWSTSTAWNGEKAARHAGILLMCPSRQAIVPVLVDAIERLLSMVDTFENRLFR
jgi:N-acetylglucosamine kinase-like BadF-type ATPase